VSTSKIIILSIIGTLIVLAVSFYLGMVYEKSRFVNTPIIVKQVTNLDSLKDLWLHAKVDSVDYADAIAEIEELRSAKPETRRDTILVPMKIPVFSVDTTIKASGEITTTDEEDTLQSTYTTNVHARIQFYPPPIQMFGIRSLSVDPIFTTFKRKRSVVPEKTFDFPLSFDVSACFGHAIGMGGAVNWDDWGVGVILIAEEKPLYLVKRRFSL